MGIERPAERAAGILGVDRHRGAALVDNADDLATATRALAHCRGARVFDSGIVEAVAVSAAGADRERAGGLGCADRGDQDAKARGGERKTSRGCDRRYDHWRAPPPKDVPKLAGKGFRLVNPTVIPGRAQARARNDLVFSN